MKPAIYLIRAVSGGQMATRTRLKQQPPRTIIPDWGIVFVLRMKKPTTVQPWAFEGVVSGSRGWASAGGWHSFQVQIELLAQREDSGEQVFAIDLAGYQRLVGLSTS
jgi:hypothetical protein